MPAQPVLAQQSLSIQGSNDDDFGDFESGDADEATTNTNERNVAHDPWSDLAGLSSSASVPPTNATQPVVPDQQQHQQYFPRPLPLHEQNQPKKARPKAKVKQKSPALPRDPNVFFDAEEDEETGEEDEAGEDDDFGSFVAPEPEKQLKVVLPPLAAPPAPVFSNAVQKKQVSLLDFDDDPGPFVTSTDAQNGSSSNKNPAPAPMQDSSGFEWDDFESSTAKPAQSVAPKRVSKAPLVAAISQSKSTPSRSSTPALQPKLNNIANDDAWDDFEATPATQTTIIPNRTSTPSMTPQPPQLPNLYQPAPQPTSLPPSNIPPPSVLLSLFPSLIKSATTQLFSHLSDHPSSTTSSATRTALLNHPTTTTFLHSYLSLAVVLGRIIAGRKPRWKRDTHLSQNMRIGTASSRGSGGSGMKLAGVDRAEASKEDREVAEVLRLWRGQVGKLRSAVSAVNAASTSGHGKGVVLPAIPELSETPVVRLAKESEGGVVAVKQCVVCALKRNERVVKVDGEVEDVFGEWWVEHWGHRSCVNFWRAWEGELRSR